MNNIDEIRKVLEEHFPSWTREFKKSCLASLSDSWKSIVENEVEYILD